MKDLFPEYENSRSVDYDEVWANSLFVFDTNALLNLYRYRIGTRDELLAVLDRISAQIWIPYQVALEFQRNRLSVIAEQIKRFSEVRRTIEKAKSSLNTELAKLKLQERHSLINPEPLIDGFEQLTKNFFIELQKLEQDQQTLSGKDDLKDRLENLFDGRVGDGFTKQEDLETLHKQGEVRYKFNIPPGYEDDSKDSKSPDEYMHGGLIYKRKYGDFIIWKQILEHCKKSGNKSLIFITDDAKEDWWRIIDLDGPKTIGPRAELIDEARRIGEIDQFLMYTPDQFLKYANDALKTQVSDAAIQEVKDISLTRVTTKRMQAMETAVRAARALRSWLGEDANVIFNAQGKAIVSAIRDGKPYTYVIAVSISTKVPIDVFDRTENLLASTVFSAPDNFSFGRIVIVWIAANPANAANIKTSLLSTKSNTGQELGVDVIVATLDDPETMRSGFFVQSEFPL
jgi:hypothetical protein